MNSSGDSSALASSKSTFFLGFITNSSSSSNTFSSPSSPSIISAFFTSIFLTFLPSGVGGKGTGSKTFFSSDILTLGLTVTLIFLPSINFLRRASRS